MATQLQFTKSIMIRLLVFFLGVGMGCQSVTAQNNTPTLPLTEEEILQELTQEDRMILNTAKGDGNNAIIDQVGMEHDATINQIQTGGGAPNLGITIQKGTSNNSYLYQEGNGLDAYNIQDGYNNTYEATMTGTDIRSRSYQDGDNNDIYQQLEGNGLDYILIQEGNNNSIIQFENSTQTDAPAYQIRQQGNGMNIYIQNSTIY